MGHLCDSGTFLNLMGSVLFQNMYSLDTISKEVRFVCLYNDNIKEVSPVFSHHVCHSFIPAGRKRTLVKQIAGELFTL